MTECARCGRSNVPFVERPYTGPFVATVRRVHGGPVCRPCVMQAAWDAATGGETYVE